MNSGFRREADEKCEHLCYYTKFCGNFLQTFRDNISAPTSSVVAKRR